MRRLSDTPPLATRWGGLRMARIILWSLWGRVRRVFARRAAPRDGAHPAAGPSVRPSGWWNRG